MNINVGTVVATSAACAAGYFVGSNVLPDATRLASEALSWIKFCDKWNPLDSSCYGPAYGQFIAIGLLGACTIGSVILTYQVVSKLFRSKAAV